MNRIKLLLLLFLFNCRVSYAQDISDYNVVWDTPSEHSGGSMPLGNGELGMNIWVEKGGDLLFYLSRTDSFSEANRLMKLGRIRVKIDPNPFIEGIPFKQELILKDGVINITAGNKDDRITINFFIDPDNDVAYITLDSKQKRNISMTVESWRTEPHTITKEEAGSAWTISPLPDNLKMVESADHFFTEKNAVAWCHANEGSQLYDLTMRHQGKEAYAKNFPDPISKRTFGAYITAEGLHKSDNYTFTSKGAVGKATLKIATYSAQVGSIDEWMKQVKAVGKKSAVNSALVNSKKWWNDFWDRSYIYIDIPSDKEFGHLLTQSYILQRYVSAGGGRGNFPIKFNGSIFTVDPVHTYSSKNYSPDYRDWGGEFWWQNTRLPYYAMLTSGDFDMMKPMFGFYLDRMDAFRTMASKYYGAKGIFIPETVTPFGTYANGDWGWDRTGLTSNDVNSMYLRYIWVQGLELSKLMLDYYLYTGDEAFLTETALPTIKEVLLYFDSRFVKDGRMRIDQSQSLETYWYNVVNDMPCIAGLHYLTSTLTTLPQNLIRNDDRDFFAKLAKTLPGLPRQKSVEGDIFTPAEEYLNRRNNVENPELYPVFPFGLANLTNDLKATATRTFNRRVEYQARGWGQDGQVAAMLGLVDETVEMLKLKVKNTHPNQRFLAMWGPNYDWVPDQDHGSNLLLTLQYMLLQNYNGKAYLLPAWPNDWNVSFKLAATGQTSIEGEYINGNLDYLKTGGTQVISIK